MKTKTILSLAFLLATITIKAQNLDWVKSFGGSSNDEGISIAVDASGNVYTTGYFEGTVDFAPGTGTSNLTSTGLRDAFIQKLNASGNFQWARSLGGSGVNVGYSITVDASGNVYTTGSFEGTADFDPGTGTANLSSAGGNDIFIQKLDASGNFLWAKSIGGSNSDYGLSIKVDNSGNVYTTGNYEGTVDFDPGAGTANLTSVFQDVFVIKLNASGDYLWAKSFGGGWNNGNALTIDAQGNVYTTGFFQGTVDFDPGAGTTNLTSVELWDVYVQKLDTSGNFLWAKSFGGSSWDTGLSATVDASGNVYTTGFFQGTVDFDPGTSTANLTPIGIHDAFVQKLDPSGNFLWVKSIGGNVSAAQGNSITVDASGNVYTTGYFTETVDIDPGAGTANLTSAGLHDIFVQKLDTYGNFLWARSFGGSEFDIGSSITVDASGNFYTTGAFEGTADFDSIAGTVNLSSAGSFDVFVQKMSQGEVTRFLEIARGIQLKAFPNPSQGLVELAFEQPLHHAEIRVIDSQGKTVLTKELDAGTKEQINIDGLAGIYYLSVKTVNGQSIVKLIKE